MGVSARDGTVARLTPSARVFGGKPTDCAEFERWKTAGWGGDLAWKNGN